MYVYDKVRQIHIISNGLIFPFLSIIIELQLGVSLYMYLHRIYPEVMGGIPGVWHYNGVIMGAIASQITSLTIVYSTVYSDADQRKHQSSASLAFVRGIHRGPVNSPHKWPVTRKMFPFDDVIMILDQTDQVTREPLHGIEAMLSCQDIILLRLPAQALILYMVISNKRRFMRMYAFRFH